MRGQNQSQASDDVETWFRLSDLAPFVNVGCQPGYGSELEVEIGLGSNLDLRDSALGGTLNGTFDRQDGDLTVLFFERGLNVAASDDVEAQEHG